MIFWFLLLVTVFGLADCDTKIPVYTIDLDLPPEERWGEIARDFRDDANILLTISKKFLPLPLLKLAWYLADKLDNLPTEYAKEIQGMAKSSGIPAGELISLTIFYDISAFYKFGKSCTGILAEDLKGHLFHGRNFDYFFGNLLKRMVLTVDFQRKNQTVFSVTTFAYLASIFTGQKPKAFTISINERDSGSIFDNVLMALYTKFHLPVGIVVRKVLEEANTFDEAVDALSRVHLVAPVYFIVGGRNSKEGVIITRDRLKPANTWWMNDTKTQWYLVETNYDHWKPTPPGDNRRAVANKEMKLLGRENVTADSLFKILSKYPVKNENTLFTIVMSASSPQLYHDTARIRS